MEKALKEMKELVHKSVVIGDIGIRASEVKSGFYGEKVKSFVENLELVK